MNVHQVTLDGREYVMIPRRQWDVISGVKRGTPVKLPLRFPDGAYSIEHVRLSLAKKVAAQRIAAKMTQVELARRARVRPETISRLENGLHMPSVRTFERITRALERRA